MSIASLLSIMLLVLTSLALLSFAVLEYVDLPTPYPPGSSPINPGKLGTSKFVELLRRFGISTVYVSSWSRVVEISGRICVLIVSPEYPYDLEEIEAIAKILKSSNGILVIADETKHSNQILEALGAGVRVRGEYVIDERGEPYPKALFKLEDREVVVRLDKASDLVGCAEVFGFVETYEEHSPEPEMRAVGCVERVEGVFVLVLGDGSLLINQALGLGGPYEELAKLLALTVRRYCGARSSVYVEAGKYRSDPILFRSLLDSSSEARHLILLNDIVYHLLAFKQTLRALAEDPLVGLREELVALAAILATFAVVARFKRSPEAAAIAREFTRRSREDFRVVYESVLKAVSLLGCDPGLSDNTIRCLVEAGLERRYALELVRFLSRSKRMLGREILLYVPIWKLMTARLLALSERLVELLGRRVTRSGKNV